MTPMQRLRQILVTLGYRDAAARLPDLPPAQAEARIIAWKRWAQAQRRAEASPEASAHLSNPQV